VNILWHSNSPATPSGYGNQTKLFTARLARAGHQVTISAFYGREGSALRNEDGIYELPRAADPYGNDIIQAHRRFVGADIVFSLIDPFVLQSAIWSSFPWAAWVPVDSAPMLPQNVVALQAARWVIAMSRFGEEQLRAAGFDPLYVPHGIETAVYKPIEREAARAAFEQFTGRVVGDHFLVMSVAANKGNPSRKNFAAMLEAFAQFATTHPDALLYLHTEASGMWQGEPILQMAQSYGVADKLIVAPQYPLVCGLVGGELMNQLYNAADTFMLLSRGEGFGIPLVEAQSAGCPVIVTDFSASRELCGSGWRVPGLPYMFVAGTQQLLAFPSAAAAALNAAYTEWQDPTQRATRRLLAREWALAYDADQVMDTYFAPTLARIERDLRASADSTVRETPDNPPPIDIESDAPALAELAYG